MLVYMFEFVICPCYGPYKSRNVHVYIYIWVCVLDKGSLIVFMTKMIT